MGTVVVSGPVGRSADLQAAAAAGRAVRFRARVPYGPLLYIAPAVMLAAGISLTAEFSDILAAGKEAPAGRAILIFLIALGTLVLAAGVWVLFLVLRPAVTIAAGSLLIPRGAFGTIRVPVSEVTGIGPVAERSVSGRGPPPSWHMLVWHGDQRSQPVNIRYTPADARRTAAETDPAELAGSYAGQVAGGIYRYVLAQQGSAGPLAVTEQQKHVRHGSRWAAVSIEAF
jgi:hypothetical protein